MLRTLWRSRRAASRKVHQVSLSARSLEHGKNGSMDVARRQSYRPRHVGDVPSKHRQYAAKLISDSFTLCLPYMPKENGLGEHFLNEKLRQDGLCEQMRVVRVA